MDVVQQVVGLGRSAREDSRVRVRQPLARMLISVADTDGGGDARAAIQKHAAQIGEELNIKSVEFIEQDAGLVGYEIKPNFATLGKRYGKRMPAIKAALANLDAADGADLAARVAADEDFSLDIDGLAVAFEPGDLRVHTTSAEGYACARAGRLLVALDTTLSEALLVEGIAREIVRTVQDARKSAGLEIADRIALAISGSKRVQAALREHREYIAWARPWRRFAKTVITVMTSTASPRSATSAKIAGASRWPKPDEHSGHRRGGVHRRGIVRAVAGARRPRAGGG